MHAFRVLLAWVLSWFVANPQERARYSLGEAAWLVALGYQPGKHGIVRVMRPTRGVRIVDRRGEPLRFFTHKQLKRPEVKQRWALAMRELRKGLDAACTIVIRAAAMGEDVKEAAALLVTLLDNGSFERWCA